MMFFVNIKCDAKFKKLNNASHFNVRNPDRVKEREMKVVIH